MQTRRNWIRSSIGLGGLLLAPELALSKEEIRKFNPRPLSKTIKLSSNENPYGPSEKVQKAVIKAFENGCRYPRVYSSALANKLAKLHGVSSENIIITGGSTEGLKITGLTFANGGGEILIGGQTSRATFSTDLDEFYFGKKIVVDQGIVSSNDEDLKLRCANNTQNTNIILKKSTVDPVVSINGDLRVNAHGNNFGKVLAANDIIALASDKRLKENIIEISNPLDKIQQVRGVYFDWNQKSKEKGFKAAREKNEIGMIAQEVEQIIPQAIEPAPFNKEYKTIKYDRLIPLLVECIKDQQKQIDELKSKIN